MKTTHSYAYIILLSLLISRPCITKADFDTQLNQALEATLEKRLQESDQALSELLKGDLKLQLQSAQVTQCSTDILRSLVLQSYPIETHTVTTEDGYILSLFRIQAKGGKMEDGKPVVFLQHGLFNDATSWLYNGEDKGLGFLLANAGFDVWMGNNRGNKYSRRHKTYTTANSSFWEFSFDEMAKYDLPANLAYVSKIAGTHHIRYVGHSQGTSQMFAALSDPQIRPKVAPYVAVFYALAPIVFLNKIKIRGINFAAYLRKLVKLAVYTSNTHALNTGTCTWDQSSINYWNDYCRNSPKKCYSHVGYEDLRPEVDNWPREGYRRILGPSGASFNCVLHYAQLISYQSSEPNAFRKFDHGSEAANKKHYGQKAPPLYNLELVREKVRLWVGSMDTLGTLEETMHLMSSLINAKDVKLEVLKDWGHETFHFAANNEDYYGKLVAELKRA